ncbi:MAG: hypothetical protein EOP09_12070, partial [Proteobacteria bacterium]
AITIVDLRKVFKIAEPADLAHAKVLIVEREGAKYGLMVDGVESIVSYYEEHKLAFPKALLREQHDEFHNEVQELVEVQMSESGEKRCLMILDLKQLLDRLTASLRGRSSSSSPISQAS